MLLLRGSSFGAVPGVCVCEGESAPHKSWGCNAQGRVSRAEQSRVLSMADKTELGRRPEKVGRQLVSLGDMAHSMRVRKPGKVQGREAKDRRRGASKLS